MVDDESKACRSVPCPTFETVDIHIVASAPVGHSLVEGVTADQHNGSYVVCTVCTTQSEDASAR